MSLKNLSESELVIAFRCMEVILHGGPNNAHGTSIDHDDFQTRLGVTAEELARMIESWPDVDDSADDSPVTVAINNCFNEIAHGLDDRDLKRYPDISRAEVKLVYRHWVGDNLARGGVM